MPRRVTSSEHRLRQSNLRTLENKVAEVLAVIGGNVPQEHVLRVHHALRVDGFEKVAPSSVVELGHERRHARHGELEASPLSSGQ